MGRGVEREGDGHEGGFHTLVGNSQTAPEAPVFLRGKLILALRGDIGSEGTERDRDRDRDLPSPRARSGASPGRPGAPHILRPAGRLQTGFSGSASLPGTRWGIR